MKKKQQSFLKEPRKKTKKWWIETQHVYGGSLNYRKCARPFDSNKLVHSVLKAKLGKGIWFTRSHRSIEKLLRDAAYRYGIKIKSFSIQKDHIHLFFWVSGFRATQARKKFQNFLKFIACEMGRKYKIIFASFGVKNFKGLWSARPFTRLVGWGRKAVQTVIRYIEKNELEVMGFAPYTPRNHQLNDFLSKWVNDGS